MEASKLTFVVASYNYDKYLNENLDSLCRQWKKEMPFEILVVDDGSTDNSLSIAQSFSSRFPFVRVLVHENHVNCGLVESLKLAISKVSTEWIAFLESDDVSSSGSLEKILNVINSCQEGLVFFDIEPLLESTANKGWFDAYVPRMRKLMLLKGADKEGVFLDKEILYENLIPTFSCAIVKKRLIEQCSFDSPVRGWVDWFLWIQIAQVTKVRFIDQKLVQWRIHGKSQNNKKALFSYFRQYSAFRISAKKRIKAMDVKYKFSKITILSLPSIIIIGIRFLKMVRYAGFKEVVKQIYGRLNR